MTFPLESIGQGSFTALEASSECAMVMVTDFVLSSFCFFMFFVTLVFFMILFFIIFCFIICFSCFFVSYLFFVAILFFMFFFRDLFL